MAIDAEEQFHDASRAFVGALRRLLSASIEDEMGELDSLSQTWLSEEAGIGRSTLSKYLVSTDATPANPTLEVLCRLAHVLGVPPAFLLMTADDWARLGSAINYFLTMTTDDRFLSFADKVMSPEQGRSARDFAEAGLLLGRMLGLNKPAPSDAESQRRSDTSSHCIAATCVTVPLHELHRIHRPALLALCAIIGANTQRQA